MSLISCDAAQVVGWKHLLMPNWSEGEPFAANIAADMQQNFMVDPHRPCLEPLGLHICGPGGLKHNLHRLQIHKDWLDFN